MRARVVLTVLLGLSWGVLAWLWVRTSRQDAVIGSLERQLRLAQVKAPEAPAAATRPAPVDNQAKPARAGRDKREVTAEPVVDPELESLREKVQNSAANMAKLQARISELETEVLNVMGERAHAASAESEAHARVDELTRTVQSMSADRSAAEKHQRDLEAEIGRLREQNAAAAEKHTQAGQLSGELHDITRRQQVYVTNILRRYREVTDMFRALPGMLESKGNGPELMRIQTAISMADEDVRQLNDLSARLGRLEKRISAAAGR